MLAKSAFSDNLIRIRLYFKWFDLWLGIYIDTEGKKVYVGIPMFGICFEWGIDPRSFILVTEE